jgi:hypothetical protein
VVDIRLEIAMSVYPELVRLEIVQAYGEHRPASYPAAAEDAFRAADALLAEALPAQVGPRDLQGPIDVSNGVPDNMTNMPPCAPGQRYHRQGPGGRCSWCGIEVAVVRDAVIRNQNRHLGRKLRKQAKEIAAKEAAG